MWVPLNDYAHQYQVSISTLRRRIKTNSIKFKLEKGKYFIWADEEAQAATTTASSAPVSPRGTTAPSAVVDELLKEKERRIDLLEQHVRVLHQEIESLQSLVRMLESQ